MMVFFVGPDQYVYGRYGGRESIGTPLSPAGLQYSMRAALDAHRDRALGETVTRSLEPRLARQLPGAASYRGCMHCHQVQETLYENLKSRNEFDLEMIWRFPPPANVGLTLDEVRGNVVRHVSSGSSGQQAGLQAGDILERLGDLSVRSLADAKLALDRAPRAGTLEVSWRREGQLMSGELSLSKGWRRSDITWRASLRSYIPAARVFGRDLTAAEKHALGFSPERLAFRQFYPVSSIAYEAGVREGDIVLGFDGRALEMSSYDFLGYVRRNYLVGDQVTIDLIREGEQLALPMTLR